MPYEANVTDVAYRYDGSFAGFLCCVFESYARHEIPSEVCSPEEGQLNLFGTREILTDRQRAKRVAVGLDRLGPQVKDRIVTGFLSTDPGKDLTLLRFARRCFAQGPQAVQMLGDPDVAAAFAIERAVNNEAGKFIEFIRFEERDGMLGTVIHPKHQVLPLLRGYFCSRLPDENFLIFDATHGTALVRRGGQVQYLTMEHYTPGTDEDELNWQQLWKRFFQGADPRGTPQRESPDEPRAEAVLERHGGDAGQCVTTRNRTPGWQLGTRSGSGAGARCQRSSCGRCQPAPAPWRECPRRRASANAPG